MIANLWQDTAGAAIGAEPLERDAAADVVIIGGGFTGCSAALHLAEAGASVILLEAEVIGHGGSGRNVGLVNAGLWLEPEKVETRLGRAAGVRLNDILAGGPELVFALIEKHGISCEAVRSGTLHLAHSRRALAGLQERLRQYRARNWPVTPLDAGETRAKTGTDAYCGALLDVRAGTVQPLAYARGLARAAVAAGVRLHQRTPALAVTKRSGRWQVATPGGGIQAEALLLATNAYHVAASGVPSPRHTAMDYFQLATVPLDEALRGTVLPERQGCWDTGTVMSSFRMDAAGRLILGAFGSLDGPGSALHRGWARRKLAALFPAAADLAFEHGWHGRIAMTADHLPKIVSLGPRAISIFGYSGRGIAPGTVFGKAAAAFLAGGDENALPVPVREAYSETLTRAKAAYYGFGAAALHLVGAR